MLEAMFPLRRQFEGGSGTDELQGGRRVCLFFFYNCEYNLTISQ